MNRLGLKIVCLVVSTVIWGLVAARSDVEQSVNMPLQVIGLEQSLTVDGSVLPDKVAVSLFGSKWRLLRHKYLNHNLGEVRINLSDREAGPVFYYEVTTGDVFTDGQMSVMQIYPPVRLRLQVDRIASQTMPIRLETDGILPDGKAFLVKPTVSPDSVVVTGARRFFPNEGVVPTQRVKLDQLKESQEFPLTLVPPHENLHLERSEVSVSFKVADLEDRTLANISVIPLVDSGQLEVGVSPPLVDVMVRGVADSVEALDRSRILVTVPVGSLPEGIYLLSGEVEYPPWLTLIGMDPSEFQVIVGNPHSEDRSDPTADPETPDGGGGLE